MRLLQRFCREQSPFLVALPAYIWELVFLCVPLGMIVLLSFLPGFTFLLHDYSFSISNYLRCLQPGYLKAISNSLIMAYVTAISCVIMCLPLSLHLAFRFNRWRNLMLFLFIMPSWTNFVIRIYAWFFLLSKDGYLAATLKSLGWIANTGELLANPTAVWLGMLYCYYPFVLVPMFSSINSIEKGLLEASLDLGATYWQTFCYVILPAIKRSIYFAFAIVALSAFGEFAIPEFLGGGKQIFWGNLVVNKFLFISDYSLGSALTFVGLGILLTSLVLVFLLLPVLRIACSCLMKVYWWMKRLI